jgi:hypothetical protein
MIRNSDPAGQGEHEELSIRRSCQDEGVGNVEFHSRFSSHASAYLCHCDVSHRRIAMILNYPSCAADRLK